MKRKRLSILFISILCLTLTFACDDSSDTGAAYSGPEITAKIPDLSLSSAGEEDYSTKSYILPAPTRQSGFVTTWKTDNPGASAKNQITIPVHPRALYNYSVDWGDGKSNANITGSITHTYHFPGTYTVTITGVFPQIYFNYSGDCKKILTIEQWGSNTWRSMNKAFCGCENLTIYAADTPDLSLVTDMYAMFAHATSFKGNLSYWNVRNVENMEGLFYNAASFNSDLSNWNVSSVTNMAGMFAYTVYFNSDISNWDVSKVQDMNGMFAYAYDFNADIGNWDVSMVENMESMFYNAESFNRDISRWDVSGVKNMRGMFYNAHIFESDISNWVVSKVEDMAGMFYCAYKFNSKIDNWDVSRVKDMSGMFAGAVNFNADISNWDVSSVEDMSYMFYSAYKFDNNGASLDPWGNHITGTPDMTEMFVNSLLEGHEPGWYVP